MSNDRHYTYTCPSLLTFYQLVSCQPQVSNLVFSPPKISEARESRSDIFHDPYFNPWMGHTVPIHYQVPPTPPATNTTIHHHHYYNSPNEQGKQVNNKKRGIYHTQSESFAGLLPDDILMRMSIPPQNASQKSPIIRLIFLEDWVTQQF
jgi:hypothetical protein